MTALPDNNQCLYEISQQLVLLNERAMYFEIALDRIATAMEKRNCADGIR